jgi:uncharacterized protein YecE (DUF72 family)
MGEILTGTCSWADPSLIKSHRFYPEWAKSTVARLQYYASEFPVVEVDSTYYALPKEAAAGLWVRRTGDGFRFDVKAFRLFTGHPTPLAVLPKDIKEALPARLKKQENLYYRDLAAELLEELWRRFERALLPLDSAGKLGVVTFQFPPWFRPGKEQLAHIFFCKEKLSQYNLAVEFRHGAWLASANFAATLKFLRDNNLAFICVDEPQGFSSSVPPVYAVTSDVAVIRFHGRNREAWENKGATVQERFDYLYGEDELGEWVPHIKEMPAKCRELHVLFNNCHEDKGITNARQMKLLLGGAPGNARERFLI